MCIVPPVYVKYYAKHFIHGTSFNPHKTLMRQYDYYPHFIEKETRSEKGRNLFKVVPLGSSRAGIKTQVCLLPNHSASKKYYKGLGERLLTRESNSCT